MSRRTLRLRPLPGKDYRGRRPIPTDALDEMERVAQESAAEVTERVRQMIFDRLRHVSEHIKDDGKEQEVVLETVGHPPFFTVTTRLVGDAKT